MRAAEAAGYRALVVTVDAPRLGHREADERNGFHMPAGLALGNTAHHTSGGGGGSGDGGTEGAPLRTLHVLHVDAVEAIACGSTCCCRVNCWTLQSCAAT